MLTKTKIALAALLFAGTTSIAAAQGFDPNMANRYPGYAGPTLVAPHTAASQHRTLQSAPVGLYQGRNVGLSNSPIGSYGGQQSEFDVDRSDKASSPYAGGGF